MKPIYFTLFFYLSFQTLLFCQSGELDLSFATDGIFKMDISGGTDTPHKIAVQPDHKILVTFTGDFGSSSLNFDIAVIRLFENGEIDSSFATDGVYIYDNPLGSDIPYDLLLLDNGDMLVAGSFAQEANNTDFFFFKLDTNGAMVESFGDMGKTIIPIDAGQDYARAMAIKDNGNIIVAGYSHVPGLLYKRNVMAEMDPNGNLVSSFGTDGIFMWVDGDNYDELYRVLLTPDGGILTCGYTNLGADVSVLYKVLADGSGLDNAFGIGGTVIVPAAGKAFGLGIHQNGNILVGSYDFNAQGADMVVVSFDMKGNIVNDFGLNGTARIDINVVDYLGAMYIQPDGKILVTGQVKAGGFGTGNFATARIDSLGVLDESWAENGYVETITSDFFAFPNAVWLQPQDGKVLVAGASATNTTGNDLTIIRYGNYIDTDMDGYPLGEDCNDLVFEINPGAEEIPDNGIDEDCDGEDGMASGITEFAQNKLDIFPNPVKDLIFFEIPQDLSNIQHIQISDSQGKVWIDHSNQFDAEMNVAHLPSGVYLLIIRTSKGMQTQRFIKA